MAEAVFKRQPATIVSVDAIAFSRLMGRDADLAVAAFEERFELIAGICRAYGGTTFGAAGDSLMAEFGLPIDALLAAIEFQRSIVALNERQPQSRRMRFRAGINTGDVIVRNASRYGDDVNIAARLQEMAPDAGIVISETTWHHVHAVSMARFDDLGEQLLKNILYPVRAFLVRDVDPVAESAADHGARRQPDQPAAQPSRAAPAIAVLAFRSAIGDSDLEPVAQGLADDIISGLSRVRWFPVIAGRSSFQFRDHALPAVAAGRLLGARYIVCGTLRRSPGGLKLGVALEDAIEEREIWAGQYYRPVDDLPALQAEIVAELAALIARRVGRGGPVASVAVPAESITGWQLVRRGRWHMSRRTHDDTALARACFEEALALEPNSSAALNELAWWHFWHAWSNFGTRDDGESDLDRVVACAGQALALDGADARAVYHLGVVEVLRGHPQAALDHLDRSLALNPSSALTHAGLGSAHMLLGQAPVAIRCFLEAERLSPFDPYLFANLSERAAAHCFAGQWSAAIAAAQRSLELAPAYWYARFLLVGALHRTGRIEEAQRERAAFRLRHPDFSTRRVMRIRFVDAAFNASLISNFSGVEEVETAAF